MKAIHLEKWHYVAEMDFLLSEKVLILTPKFLSQFLFHVKKPRSLEQFLRWFAGELAGGGEAYATVGYLAGRGGDAQLDAQITPRPTVKSSAERAFYTVYISM